MVFVLSGNNLRGDFAEKERLVYRGENGPPIPPVGRIEGETDQRGSWGGIYSRWMRLRRKLGTFGPKIECRLEGSLLS